MIVDKASTMAEGQGHMTYKRIPYVFTYLRWELKSANIFNDLNFTVISPSICSFRFEILDLKSLNILDFRFLEF